MEVITDNQNEEDMELRRGPWTVEEDFKLMNYIATNGEGRWNSLARCAGLKRTGKSCRLRWLNYLRPDVRRGNITLEEQLLILELHSRWGNRWSKIAQHLPGRTDNEIKNYWRTRVQKHAKQLKCDVNSKQFKDTMRYLWMPRLMERIQAASATSITAPSSTTTTTTTTVDETRGTGKYIGFHQGVDTSTNYVNNINSGHVIQQSYTPENSSTAASSDSFGTQVSLVSSELNDYLSIPVNNNPNPDTNYFQGYGQLAGYSDTLISPCGYGNYNNGFDFHGVDQINNPWMDGGDALWNVDDIWYLQQQFNNNM